MKSKSIELPVYLKQKYNFYLLKDTKNYIPVIKSHFTYQLQPLMFKNRLYCKKTLQIILFIKKELHLRNLTYK